MFIEKGVILFYDDNKGFGFIEPYAGGADVFFHVSRGSGQPEKHAIVEFESVTGSHGKGPYAQWFRVLEPG